MILRKLILILRGNSRSEKATCSKETPLANSTDRRIAIVVIPDDNDDDDDDDDNDGNICSN